LSGRRLLVRLPNWVGDGALAAPALRALRRARPDLRFILIGTARSAPLYGRWGAEGLFSIEHRKASEMVRILRTTRGVRIEESLILAPSFRAAVLPVLMGIPRRVGFRSDHRGWLLSEAIADEGRDRHIAAQFLSLAVRLGADPEAALDPRLPIGDDEVEGARRYLEPLGNGGTPIVALCPGATYGETKRWPLSHWIALARALSDDGIDLVILGGRDEQRPGQALVEALGERIRDLTGCLTLRESLALFVSLAGAVSNDSGAMHLAAAAGCPVVGLFGSTNPDWTGPLGPRSSAMSLALPCSPCYARSCPTQIECLRDLTPQHVHEEVRRLFAPVEEGRS
jgi:heptosyltransferase-2